ncbi:MAG TPA: DNA polymerase/3'-5' exonuclease PolX [Syntrophus sp. (in: bacteria)]|nr:DNA polymerase/3'-5' exonuclease PolX [Syntrophus sp. (in: bacteria)]
MERTKEEIIAILDELALLLEIKGENPFKSKAYANAARSLEALDEDLDLVVREGRLATIKGVGEAISKKIAELAATGELKYYDDLKATIPAGHFEMLKIPGLGPKKIRFLYDKLGIETIGELEYACQENRLLDLPGFGNKTQEKILAGIDALKHYRERRLYTEVIAEAMDLRKYLAGQRGVFAAAIAGSLRRGNEVVKDIDLLAATDDHSALADAFASLPQAASVIAKGDTKVSVTLRSGINADLRIVSPAQYPYALHHFTGSREHNTALRGRAKKLGIKMNEYGLFREEENLPCRSEADIFTALGLSYIPPELRENMGEIEAAAAGLLPRLVEAADMRGVLHIHTRASDGADSLEALVREAKRRGYAYIGVSDHSQSAYYAGGLSPDAVRRQHEAIDDINSREDAFHIFKGIEADILPDGSLDYDDETLERFDFVIAAVHSHFQMGEEEMTARIIKALANPFTTILAHPTGRLLLAREPYALDIHRVIDAAAAHGKVIELNANPLRLDLDWRHCIYAKKKGVKIAVNPDLHNLAGFDYMEGGVTIARKGWMGKEDCLNCMELKEISEFFCGCGAPNKVIDKKQKS